MKSKQVDFRNIKEVTAVVFDVSFILVLCFMILLITMLITSNKNNEIVVGSYHVNYIKFAVTALSVFLFLLYTVKISCNEYNIMIKAAKFKQIEAGDDDER